MDPYKSTRKEYTDKALSMPIPRDSTKEWENMVQILRTLYRLLAFHPAMATNINDTYMTPARTKNKVYFMWDFIGRTLSMAYGAAWPSYCTKADLDAEDRQAWDDVLSRSALAVSLTLDEKPGTLDRMIEGTHPGRTGVLPFGQRAEFGEEVLKATRALKVLLKAGEPEEEWFEDDAVDTDGADEVLDLDTPQAARS